MWACWGDSHSFNTSGSSTVQFVSNCCPPYTSSVPYPAQERTYHTFKERLSSLFNLQSEWLNIWLTLTSSSLVCECSVCFFFYWTKYGAISSLEGKTSYQVAWFKSEELSWFSFSLSQAFWACSVWSHLPCCVLFRLIFYFEATLIMLWTSVLRPVSSFSFLAWVPLWVCLLTNPSVVSPLYLLQLRYKMEHLPLLIRLSNNRAPVSQSTGHRATQPSPITGIRPINNHIQDIHLSYPFFFLISPSGKVILTTIIPTRPITWRTDKIWGLESCHSSVDVWMTMLPRKVHMHDWGCMGLILLHSPLCLWSICAGKRGLLIEGKTGKRSGQRNCPQMFLVVSSWRMWIFWHVILFHCYCIPNTTTCSERIRFETAPDDVKSAT